MPEEEQINVQEEGSETVFTDQMDNLKGTDGNDTFEGVQNATYQTGDKLVDPSTSDADVLNVTMATAAAQMVTVTNVETINVDAQSQGGNFNASKITGAKELNAKVGSGKDLTVQDIQELTTVVGMAGRGNLNVNFADTALSGDSPAVSLSLSGAGKNADAASTVNLDNGATNNIATVNVATTGNNFVNLTAGEKAATYTITGDGVNTLNLVHAVSSNKAAATTVDASAVESAAQTLVLAADTDADGVVDDYETLVKDDSLTGGAGTEDTLVFAADKDSKKAVATVKGFENITVKASGTALLDATNFADVTALTVEAQTAGDGLTATGLAATVATVNLDGANTLGDVSLTWAAAPSALTVNVGNTDEDNPSDLATGDLTFNTATSAVVNSLGADDSRVTNALGTVSGDKLASLTLNATDNDLTVADISGAALKSLTVDTGSVGKGVFDLTANSATGLTSITVTGDGAATFGTLANTAALKMDASEFTGDLTADFTGGAGAVTLEYKGDTRTTGTITTGAGDDDITVGNGTNKITSGTGSDDITLGDGNDTVVFGAINGTDVDTIHDFGKAGTDILNVKALATNAPVASAVDTKANHNLVTKTGYIIDTDGTAASWTTSGTATFTASDLTDQSANLATYLTEGSTATAGAELTYIINFYTDKADASTYQGSYIYATDAIANNDTVAATELHLVGVVESTDALVAGDFSVA